MKFELDEILTIVDKVKQSKLELFEYRDGDVKLKIRGKQDRIAAVPRNADMVERTVDTPNRSTIGILSGDQDWGPAGRVPTEEPAGIPIESPMVGTFYAAPSQDGEPFVKEGDHVKKGQTVGIVEAMKLMNEIEAEFDGIVTEILVKNEQMVEYGQPLIRIREV